MKTKGRIASPLEVGTGFHPELTGRENIYLNGTILGMKRHCITKRLDEIVEFRGCAKYLDTPVKRYERITCIPDFCRRSFSPPVDECFFFPFLKLTTFASSDQHSVNRFYERPACGLWLSSATDSLDETIA